MIKNMMVKIKSQTVYCPLCKQLMWSFIPNNIYYCDECGTQIIFSFLNTSKRIDENANNTL